MASGDIAGRSLTRTCRIVAASPRTTGRSLGREIDLPRSWIQILLADLGVALGIALVVAVTISFAAARVLGETGGLLALSRALLCSSWAPDSRGGLRLATVTCGAADLSAKRANQVTLADAVR